jgi:hypothetical protein
MKVSLRKANKIQVDINEVLKSILFKTEIEINEFQKPEQEISNQSKIFFDNINRRNALLKSLYEIRKLVSSANSANGVDSKLADLAFLEKEVVFFTTHSKANVRLSPDVIHGKLAKISNRSDEGNYYSKSEVETSIFTDDDINTLKTLLTVAKKEKQKLQDELLELNVQTTIQLSDETVATLKKEDII